MLSFVVWITACSTLFTEFSVQNESTIGDNISAVTDDVDQRKYGLNFHNGCQDYVKVFKCATTCKSKGFQIYRLQFKCKCTCHQKKSAQSLPYFKWRTTGTTRKVPLTKSPELWSIVGTLYPPERKTTTPAPDPTYDCIPANASTPQTTRKDDIEITTTLTSNETQSNSTNENLLEMTTILTPHETQPDKVTTTNENILEMTTIPTSHETQSNIDTTTNENILVTETTILAETTTTTEAATTI